MGTKITKVTRWTETDKYGRTTEIEKIKTCGPVCKTVKVAGTVALAAFVISAISNR